MRIDHRRCTKNLPYTVGHYYRETCFQLATCADLFPISLQLLLTYWNLPSSLPSFVHPSLACTASSWFLPHRWLGILNVSLGCKFLCWSRTVTPFQSTPWPTFYACLAIADVLKSAILTALLCSSILGLHSFLPHRWPGILHTGYSRLHLISPCLGSPPHMVSTCESLYSLSVSNCELGKTDWQEVITNHFQLMT